jgi:GTP-binding protein
MKKISIIGRSNVGKSTFFNRLVKQNKSITGKEECITRDRIYSTSIWNGYEFEIIDTGGYVSITNTSVLSEVFKQIQIAIYESELLLFMVNLKEGIHVDDYNLITKVRKYGKYIYLVVNKIDLHKYISNKEEFFKLGINKIYFISAITGEGTGDLLDDVINKLYYNQKIIQNNTKNSPIITITGAPNVGKSTFINNLINKTRSIVHEAKGTTRDPIEINYHLNNTHFTIIDSAGITKKSKITNNIDYYSIIRTIKYIKKSEICVLIVDIIQGWSSKENNIINLIKKYNKGVVIVFNKCDLLSIDELQYIKKYYQNMIQNKYKYFFKVPILFISSKKNIGLNKVMKKVQEILNIKKTKIKNSYLNKILLPIIQQHPPNNFQGKNIKIKYCTQAPIKDILFIFFTNYPYYINNNYKTFLEHKIKNIFNLIGLSIRIKFKK